jgi:hypothetical protein
MVEYGSVDGANRAHQKGCASTAEDVNNAEGDNKHVHTCAIVA